MGPEAPLRDRLVRCGAQLLAEEGAAGVTLRAIARRAGVSHGAPRRYFPTRSALLTAVAATGFDTLEQAMACAGNDRAGDPATGLRRACRAYLDFSLDNRGMFELMFRHDLLIDEHPSLRHSALPVFATFVGLVRAVQRTGWRVEIPPRVLAGSLWSSVHGLTQLWLWGALPLATDGHDPGPVLQALLDVYLPPANQDVPAPGP
jgi:AcrR family transcriptional regulator